MSSEIEMVLVPVPECPFCGARSVSDFDSASDTLMPEINRYLPSDHQALPVDLLNVRRRCSACGLIFLAPRLDAKSLARLYELWYGYAYRRVMSDPEHVEERRREFERYHLRLLEEHCPRKGRLLDVGCGSGLFLGIAKRHGWSVTGVELDPATVAWGKENEGIADLRCGVLASVLRPGEVFDAITLFDYLEHTDRPGADLDFLISHLAPRGVLMVRVPNAGGWQARFMGTRWLAVMPTHLSYFTRPVLHGALTSHGLEVRYLRAGNYRRQLDIARQRLRWLRRRIYQASERAVQSSADHCAASVQPPVGNPGSAMLRWIYSIFLEQLDHVGGWFGKGNNLTVIATKK